MKRTICLLMIIISMMASVAFADEFTLHSGVCFGMNKEQVIEAEKNNGFDATKSGNDIIVEGTIAGISYSSITYVFDDKEKLCKALYYLPDHMDDGDLCAYLVGEDMQAHWTKVSDALVEKYGFPECGTVAKQYYKLEPITGNKDTYMEINGDYSGKRGLGEQWLVPLSDGTSVLIENTFYVRTFTGQFGKGAHYIPRLRYVFCDKETTMALQKQINATIDDL